MSEDLDMVEIRAQYDECVNVCLAVFNAIKLEAPELLTDLDLPIQADNHGRHIGSYTYQNLPVLMDKLRELTLQSKATLRRVAARAMGAAVHCRQERAIKAEAHLITLLTHEDEGTRLAALTALRQMASKASPQLVSALVDHSLNDPTDRVVLGGMECLLACDRVTASRAVPALINMLTQKKSDGHVRLAACAALGELGSLSAEAIQRLLAVAGSDAERIDKPTREAAATAICQIDPSGQLIYGAASDLRDLIRLRDLVTGINVARDPIVKKLTTMIAKLADGPTIGRRRMQMKDIVAYIFGGPNSSQERNLRNWIEARRLRAISISQGLYDVDIGDLEMMRRLHQDDTAGETN